MTAAGNDPCPGRGNGHVRDGEARTGRGVGNRGALFVDSVAEVRKTVLSMPRTLSNRRRRNLEEGVARS